MRFGAPLLLVFLLVGMLAGEGGPGGIKFDDVGIAYTGRFDRAGADSVRRGAADALRQLPECAGAFHCACHDRRVDHDGAHRAGGENRLRSRLDSGSSLGRGCGVDRRCRRFLPHQCTRPAAAAARAGRAGGRVRHQRSVCGVSRLAAGRDPARRQPELVACNNDVPARLIFGCVIGFFGGQIITLVLNRLVLAQGLHAPFVAVSALVVFAFANAVHARAFSPSIWPVLSSATSRRAHTIPLSSFWMPSPGLRRS